jgi:hypothetical protein
MKTIQFLFIACCFCLACNPDKVDTKAVKKDLENQKIKKVSEGEILSTADVKGSLITDSIQKIISATLDSALSKGSIESALPYCILTNYPVINSLAILHEANISRSTFPDKVRNPSNTPDAFQKEILEAYSYTLEQNLPVFKDVQIKETEVIFNAPILLKEKQCLRCHGTVGKDLSDSEYQKIRAAYPKDKSIGYKMNDFIGLWTVKFNKQEFIKKIK